MLPRLEEEFRVHMCKPWGINPCYNTAILLVGSVCHIHSVGDF